MVKGIRLQKPSPNAMAASVGLAPIASVASATMITATAAKTHESGNQRSAQFEQRSANRAERLSAISAAMTKPLFMIMGGPVSANAQAGDHVKSIRRDFRWVDRLNPSEAAKVIAYKRHACRFVTT